MKKIIKFINTWKLKRWQSNLLYILIHFCYWYKRIKKGDRIKCWGIGYPHWKGDVFECTATSKDGKIGIKSSILVAEEDFYIIN